MIIVRAPLRISFAGGGTDLRGYYAQDFGAVCSMAINKYVYVTINNLSTFFPHRFRVAYSQTELKQSIDEISHPLVKAALKAMALDGGFDINVMADIPAGTGMGSSSTFAVSLLHGLYSFKNRLVSKERLAREASHLEIDILKEPIGKQDQYASAYGGLNLIKFFPDESVALTPIPISHEHKKRLSKNLLLFYLGGNRSASAILKGQNSRTSANTQTLTQMRNQALRTAEILSGGAPLDDLGILLREGWLLKKGLTEGITNSTVDQAIESAQAAGALGGKLLGAGGTGFILLYVPPEKQESVRREMSSYAEVQFEMDETGSTLLYYST
jgi:D-glycero-alpha-D-manno-heptose-7-phosphate kinase